MLALPPGCHHRLASGYIGRLFHDPPSGATGLLPRMRCLHTSAAESGQIFMPAVNVMLLIGVVAAVLIFGSSSALASAYGIAVTLTMVITTLLLIVVALLIWRLPPIWVGLVGCVFAAGWRFCLPVVR